MQVCKTRTIGIDGEHCSPARNTATLCRPVQCVPRQDQTSIWISTVAVGVEWKDSCRETIQVRKTRSIQVDRKHSAVAQTTAFGGRPVELVVRQNQFPKRISSIAAASEIVPVCKARAIGVNREHRAPPPTTPPSRRP